MANNLDVRIKNKYDDIANYQQSNIVLLKGEIAFGKDGNYYVLYVGDGITAFNDLIPLYSTQYKSDIDSSITTINTNISKNTDDITSVSGEVSSLKDDVSDIAGEIDNISGDVNVLKTDVGTLKTDMNTVNTKTTQLENKIEDLDEKIDQSLTSAYKAAGNIDNISELPTADAEHLGYVYNINDSFTTTVDFIEGAGVAVPAGSNVVIVETENGVYKYDVVGSFVDLTNYYDKNQIDEKVTNIQGNISDLNDEVNNLQTNVTKNTNNITTINDDITSVSGEVSSLKSDVEDLSTQLEANENNITTLTTTVNGALQKSGGVMTGTLTLNATPVANTSNKVAATTEFVQNAVSTATNSLNTSKQDVVTGTKGQITGFNDSGKLVAKDVNTLLLENGYTGISYVTCTTASATVNKIGICNDFVLETGCIIVVKFTNANTATSPTLNVNNTGNKPIKKYGSTDVDSNMWNAGAVIEFAYDGSNWIMNNGTTATTTYYGLTKLSDVTNSTSTTLAATANAVKKAYDLANTANTSVTSVAGDVSSLQSDVSTLQTDINTALTNANNAQTIANNAQTTANDAMPKSGGTFTGTVSGITPIAGDDSTKLATTAFVKTAIEASAGSGGDGTKVVLSATTPTGLNQGDIWLKEV